MPKDKDHNPSTISWWLSCLKYSLFNEFSGPIHDILLDDIGSNFNKNMRLFRDTSLNIKKKIKNANHM